MWIRNWYERMISLEYGFFQPLPIVIPQFIKAIRLDDGELFRGLLGEMSTRFHRAIEGGASSYGVRTRQEEQCAFDTCAVLLAALISDGERPSSLLKESYHGGRVRVLCRAHGCRGVLRSIKRHEWPMPGQFAAVMQARSTSGETGRTGDERILRLLARGGPTALFAVSTRATICDAFGVPHPEVGRCEALLRDVVLPFVAVYEQRVCTVEQRRNRSPLCLARQRVQLGELWCELAADWDASEDVSEQLRLVARLVRLLARDCVSTSPPTSPVMPENLLALPHQ